jgi:hypothetical protein
MCWDEMYSKVHIYINFCLIIYISKIVYIHYCHWFETCFKICHLSPNLPIGKVSSVKKTDRIGGGLQNQSGCCHKEKIPAFLALWIPIIQGGGTVTLLIKQTQVHKIISRIYSHWPYIIELILMTLYLTINNG